MEIEQRVGWRSEGWALPKGTAEEQAQPTVGEEVTATHRAYFRLNMK